MESITGSSLCFQTSADSSYAATVEFGSAEVTMKDTTLRCTLSSYSDRWSLHFWGVIAYDGTVRLVKAPEKCYSLGSIQILEEAGVQLSLELGHKMVDENARITRSHAAN